MGKQLKKGSVVLVNLDSTKGHEQSGVRPAIVLSGESFHVSGLCFICPLTTVIKNYFGNVYLKKDNINGLDSDSEALVSQVRSIDQDRINNIIGMADKNIVKEILKGFDIICDR